jgi:hypothetical protein
LDSVLSRVRCHCLPIQVWPIEEDPVLGVALVSEPVGVSESFFDELPHAVDVRRHAGTQPSPDDGIRTGFEEAFGVRHGQWILQRSSYWKFFDATF